MTCLFKKALLCVLLIGVAMTIRAQKKAVPFVSEYYDQIPLLPDSIPELKLLSIRGDSRWMHPYAPTAGDIRYAAHDSIIVIGGGDYITAWNAESGQLLWEYRFDHIRGNSNNVRSLSVSKEKPWVMAANDGNGLFIFNFYSGQLLHKFEHKGQFVFGAMSPDGKWAVGYSQYLGWKLWEVESGLEKYAGINQLFSISFSPDSKQLAMSEASNEPQLVLLELKSGLAERPDFELNNQMRTCQSLQYSPDGKLLAMGFWGGEAAVWDLENKVLLFKDRIDKSWVDALSFSPDGKRLLIMGAVEIRIWERETKKLTNWSPPADLLPCVWEDGSWSRDGEHILLAAREWQCPGRFLSNETAKELYPKDYLRASPNVLAFSEDGKTLAAMTENKGAILFWEASKPEPMHLLNPPVGCRGFSQIRFSQNAKYFGALATSTIYSPEDSFNTLYSFPSFNSLDVKIKGNDFIFGKNDKSLIGISYAPNNIFDYQFSPVQTGKQRIEEDAVEMDTNFSKDPAHLSSQLWQSHSTNLSHWLNCQMLKLLPAPVEKWHNPPSQLMCEHYFGGFTKNKSYYAGIGNDRIIYVYDGKTGKPVAGKATQGCLISTVTISPDGKYVAAVGWDSLIRLYEIPYLK